ncbi:MAG: MBL fold metallo-hydrolase [Burkholderiales bacterium]|nr:MBL fold metallo-hydrolase [Burkholderiales bacterium]
MARVRGRGTPSVRSPGRASGGALIAVLALLLMLGLAAGLSAGAARMLANSAPPPASALSLPPLADAHEPAAEDAADHAVARAAEAGLLGMRVQFAQPRQDADAGPGASLEAADARIAAESRGAADAMPRRQLRLPPAGRAIRYGPPAEGSVTWLGEATVLIRSHGLTVLTDPTFLRRGEPAHIVPGLPTPRRVDPALDIDELPPIDLVIVSRLREDHFDRLARRLLPRDVPIVAPLEARTELVAMGFASVHALPAWGSLRIDRGDTRVQLTATPTRSGPPGLASLLPASMGTLMAFGTADEPPAYRIWISGDTGIDDALLAALVPRLGDLDLALLHVGGTSVLGLGGSMDAAQSLRAVARIAPRTAIPLRLEDFSGAARRVPPPPSLARAVRDAAPGAPRVRLLERGGSHRFAPLQHWALAAEGEAASAGR